MIDDTIAKIEARLQSAESVRPERREEMVELLGRLRQEVAQLQSTDRHSAESIAGLADSCAAEATCDTPDADRLSTSLSNLNASVQGFEASHPRLVQVVNSISQTLANLGI